MFLLTRKRPFKHNNNNFPDRGTRDQNFISKKKKKKGKPTTTFFCGPLLDNVNNFYVLDLIS